MMAKWATGPEISRRRFEAKKGLHVDCYLDLLADEAAAAKRCALSMQHRTWNHIKKGPTVSGFPTSDVWDVFRNLWSQVWACQMIVVFFCKALTTSSYQEVLYIWCILDCSNYTGYRSLFVLSMCNLLDTLPMLRFGCGQNASSHACCRYECCPVVEKGPFCVDL